MICTNQTPANKILELKVQCEPLYGFSMHGHEGGNIQ